MKRLPFSGAVLVLLVLLALATAINLLILTGSLREPERQEQRAAARVVVESIAATMTRARQLGIPVERLVGLDDLARARMGTHSGLSALQLRAADGRELWHHGTLPADDKEVLSLPVGTDGVTLHGFVDPQARGHGLSHLAVRLALVAACLALLLGELLHLLVLHPPRFALALRQRQGKAIASGDFRTVWRPSHGRRDERLRQLRDRVFLLNERHQRIVRLLGSLQRTEPDAERRRVLASILPELDARQHFSADGIPEDVPVWPAIVYARWFSLLAIFLAASGLWLLPVTAEAFFDARVLLPFAVGALLGSAWRAPWPLRLGGALALGGLSCLVLAWSEQASVLAASRCLGGAAAALALDAFFCARAQAYEDWPRFSIASPLLAVACAAPLLGRLIATGSSPLWLASGGFVLALAGCAGWLYCQPAQALVATLVPEAKTPRSRLLMGFLAGMVWLFATQACLGVSFGTADAVLGVLILPAPALVWCLWRGTGNRWLTGALALCALAACLSWALPAPLSEALPMLTGIFLAGAVSPLLRTGAWSQALLRSFCAGLASALIITFGVRFVANTAPVNSVGLLVCAVGLLALACRKEVR